MSDSARSTLKVALFATLVVLISLGLAILVLTFVQNVPDVSREKKVVFVHPGSTVREIARVLKDEGVLKTRWKFRLLTKLLGKQRALRPGEYVFEMPMPPKEVLAVLLEGKSVLHPVTFPEGLTMKEMKQILVTKNLGSDERFEKLLRDRAFLARLQLPADSLEGFLFPDTYNFTRLDGEAKIFQTMVARFRQALTPENQLKAQQFGFSLLEWVTLASIIEKESSLVAEQPTISAVFHNRLKKKMRLQSDPTVIYGIPNYDGNIRKTDLQTPTPYNTYTRSGLPPGPIASPGASSLHAAVNPADVDFIYFVAMRDGTHAFSVTYQEHLKNVATYQLRRSSRE